MFVTVSRGPIERLRGAIDVLYREMLKFGIVGAGAFVIDAGGFNLLVYGGGHGPLHNWPLTAKILSAGVSIIVAWLGNRYWTFRHRRRPQVHHELMLFVGVNGVGLLIAVSCLGISRYVLGFESPVADNLSGTIIGTALGTLFRFWAYRQLVFVNEIADDGNTTSDEIDDDTDAETDDVSGSLALPTTPIVLPPTPTGLDAPR
jgi:putative flippase GtrA